MTDNPNIKYGILKYILDNSSGTYDSVNLREYAEYSGYSENRIARKSVELTVLECGVSPMQPWIRGGKREEAEELVEMWEQQE